MENKDIRYQEIKEMGDKFFSFQLELKSIIEEYLVDVLRKFNDDFIEFDVQQQAKTKYCIDNNLYTLTALQIGFYNCPYVELSFEDDYDNSFIKPLSDMTIEQQINVVENVKEYIEKYGYKNSNDI